MDHANGVISPQTRPAARARLLLLMTSPPSGEGPPVLPAGGGVLLQTPSHAGARCPLQRPDSMDGLPAAAPPIDGSIPLRTRPAQRGRLVAQAPPSHDGDSVQCPHRNKAWWVLELCNSDNNADMGIPSIQYEEKSSELFALCGRKNPFNSRMEILVESSRRFAIHVELLLFGQAVAWVPSSGPQSQS